MVTRQMHGHSYVLVLLVGWSCEDVIAEQCMKSSTNVVINDTLNIELDWYCDLRDGMSYRYKVSDCRCPGVSPLCPLV